MSEFDKSGTSTTGSEKEGGSAQTSSTERQQKLAKQLRDNLARRKNQSKARNTKPRKFKKLGD